MTFTVESADAFKARVLDTARALDKGEWSGSEVHLSFADIETLLAVLTPKRFTLLRALRRMGPTSVRALSAAVKRDYKAVHSDVAAMIAYGLIDREAKDRISVRWDHVHADLRLAA